MFFWSFTSTYYFFSVTANYYFFSVCEAFAWQILLRNGDGFFQKIQWMNHSNSNQAKTRGGFSAPIGFWCPYEPPCPLNFEWSKYVKQILVKIFVF